MENLSLSYIIKFLGTLLGVPIRLYEYEQLTMSHYPVVLPWDPLEACQNEVFSIREHVGYYVTQLSQYYGVVNSQNRRVVVGPIAYRTDELMLRELALQAGVPNAKIPQFLSAINSISQVPFISFLRMLCVINHILNQGEMLHIADIVIYDDIQTDLTKQLEKSLIERTDKELDLQQEKIGYLSSEEMLMEIVQRGDTAALQEKEPSVQTIHSGTMAADEIRQLRNLFIMTITLASRAAIRGGMREDEALSLCDEYIQRVELTTSPVTILNLQHHMILEYTKRVEALHNGKHQRWLVVRITNYVREHLYEPVTVERIAETLHMSRPHLSAKFKQVTGENLSDYILREKMEEAKRLLRYSYNKSSAEIGAQLSYSTTAHFFRVFKKYTGMTPREYRQQYTA